MADEDDGEDAGTQKDPHKPGGTRIPWIVMGVLILVFGVASAASTKKKTKPFKLEGSRAVVVPTSDRSRIVVISPCSPIAAITQANASSIIQVPGAIAVSFPRGGTSRTLVVPRCKAQASPQPGALNVPSSAFVLGPGGVVSSADKVPKGANPVAFGIRQQVTVPTGSPATTIVAAPCQGKAKAVKVTVIRPSNGSNVAIAPRC
jgi:hypothetical protein